jgi:predicted permease
LLTPLVQVARDLRHAIRILPAMPGLAAVVIGSIAVGIGVNTTVFSWAEFQIVRPLPGVSHGSRVQLIEPRGENESYPGTSWREYRDLQGRLPSFEAVIAFRMSPFSIGLSEVPERATGLLVSPNYFDALGLSAARGRLPHEMADAAAAADPIVILSHDYWRSRFGGGDVVGTSIVVNDRPFTIAGVAPERFQGTIMGLSFDLFVPAPLATALFDGASELDDRRVRGYSAMGLLRSATSRAAAQADLDAAMRQLAQEFPDTNGAITAEVLPLWQAPRGPQRFLTTALVLLQGAMLLVLLAVCGNTANLVLARASAREAEMRTRLALGAGRWRVISLVLSECVVLAGAGAALGVLIAAWGTDALRAVPMPSPMGMTVRFQTGIDGVTVLFAAALGLASALMFGLPAALHLSRSSAASSGRLRASASASQAPTRSGLRDVLMAVEVALAVIVLGVAALFLRSFADTQSIDPGFRRDGTVLAAYDLRGRSRSIAPDRTIAFAAALTERLRALPGVEAAAIAGSIPLDIHGMPSRAFTLEGRGRSDGRDDTATTNTVTPGYFKTMGIPIVEGRDFTDLLDPQTAAEAMVNAEFVRHYLGDRAAIGRTIDSGGRRYTIVGVVRDSLSNAFGEPPTPCLYFSYRDRPSPAGEVHVRTRAGGETAIVPAIRRTVRDLDATLPLYNVRTLNEHVDKNLLFRRIPARIFAALVPVLLLLAGTGIYAVVAYAVARRQPEIGIRLALGATGPQVVRQLVGETLRIVALGSLAGWVVAILIDRDLSGDAPAGPVALALVPLALLLVAMLASWLPARRAARVDVTSSLKHA